MPPSRTSASRTCASFCGDLGLVGEILEATAAAGRIVGAGRLDPLAARLEHLGRQSLREAALHLRHAGPHEIAGQPSADEDDEAVQTRDAVAAERERVDASSSSSPIFTGAAIAGG